MCPQGVTFTIVPIERSEYGVLGKKKFVIRDSHLGYATRLNVLYVDEDTYEPLGIVILEECGRLDVEDAHENNSTELLAYLMEKPCEQVQDFVDIDNAAYIYIYRVTSRLADATDPRMRVFMREIIRLSDFNISSDETEES